MPIYIYVILLSLPIPFFSSTHTLHLFYKLSVTRDTKSLYKFSCYQPVNSVLRYTL
jgi:hypothetical protein